MSVRLVAPVALALAMLACRSNEAPAPKPETKPQSGAVEPPRDAAPVPLPEDPYLARRLEMVASTIEARGIVDPRVITAMRLTPRHEFVPPAKRGEAYEDRPIEIGFGLTISQPYIVAAMTEAARVKPGDKVLEIGTGSGYQAAVLAMMGAKVYTIEIHEDLGKRTADVLATTGFKHVKTKIADGWFGWPEEAPFDAILVTCATPVVPDRLVQQLKVGGRLVAPIGDYDQALEVITKKRRGIDRTDLMDAVRFGPMIGVVEAER